MKGHWKIVQKYFPCTVDIQNTPIKWCTKRNRAMSVYIEVDNERTDMRLRRYNNQIKGTSFINNGSVTVYVVIFAVVLFSRISQNISISIYGYLLSPPNIIEKKIVRGLWNGLRMCVCASVRVSVRPCVRASGLKINEKCYFSVISWPILMLFVLSDRAWCGLQNFYTEFWNSLIMQIYANLFKINEKCYFSVISWPILILFVLSDRAWCGLQNFYTELWNSLIMQIYANLFKINEKCYFSVIFGRFWFCLFYLIGLGAGFKTSTQNFQIYANSFKSNEKCYFSVIFWPILILFVLSDRAWCGLQNFYTELWNSLIMQIYANLFKINEKCYFSVISWPILILFVLSDRAWCGLQNFYTELWNSLIMQIYAHLFKINEKCHLSSIQKSQQICTWGGDIYYASRNLLFACSYENIPKTKIAKLKVIWSIGNAGNSPYFKNKWKVNVDVW